MQKVCKKLGMLILAILLIAGVGYGGVKAQAVSNEQGNDSVVEDNKGNSVELLKPNYLELAGSKKPLYYNINFAEGVKEVIIPVEITKEGTLFLTLQENDSIFSMLNGAIYSDEKCTKQVGRSADIFKDSNTTIERVININKAGTYYLKLNLSRKYNNPEQMQFYVRLDVIKSGIQTMKNKASYMGYVDFENSKRLYQIKVTEPGLVTFTVTPKEEGYQTGNFRILDSKKKELSEKQYVNTKQTKTLETYYALKKGTYYVEVDARCELYEVGYKFTAVEDKSGASMAKATNIKVGGSAVKGMVASTDKTSISDWFKITLTSSKKINIDIASKVDGTLRLEVCDSKGNTLWYGNKSLYNGSDTLSLESSKLPKGTYYFRIYKDIVGSSGYYSIKIK